VKGKISISCRKKKANKKGKGWVGALAGWGRGRCILTKLVKEEKTKENLV